MDMRYCNFCELNPASRTYVCETSCKQVITCSCNENNARIHIAAVDLKATTTDSTPDKRRYLYTNSSYGRTVRQSVGDFAWNMSYVSYYWCLYTPSVSIVIHIFLSHNQRWYTWQLLLLTEHRTTVQINITRVAWKCKIGLDEARFYVPLDTY